MTAYLEEHPPVRSQYRNPRRSACTGAVVVHTAETVADEVLPDNKAEAVAEFIRTRTTPGSYHDLVDSDSFLNLCRYEWEAYHEGTGGNRWSLSVSFACGAAEWPNLSAEWRTRALQNGARAAHYQSQWQFYTYGFRIPARRITAEQYRSGVAGFVGHGELDPFRRTDPGKEFPWNEFLYYYQALEAPYLEPAEEENLLLERDARVGLLTKALDDLDQAFLAYRGSTLSQEERGDWTKQLAHAVAYGGDVLDVVRFAYLWLAGEFPDLPDGSS